MGLFDDYESANRWKPFVCGVGMANKRQDDSQRTDGERLIARMAIVTHESYGCLSGCCGHRIIIKYDNKREASRFSFYHPNGIRREQYRRWAEDFVQEFVTRYCLEGPVELDWDNSEIFDH